MSENGGAPRASAPPRRFKPKAPSPVPAAAVAAAAAAAAAVVAEAPQSEAQPGARPDRARTPGRGAGRSTGRGGGGGRKGFVVPTGESFFTGGTTKPATAPEPKQPRAAAAAGSGKASSQSSVSAWLDLGVEHVVAASSIDKLKEATKGKRKNKQSEQVVFGNDDESDIGFESDEDDGDEDVVMAEAERRARGAPKAFSELLPVTLPLGPRTLTARRAQASAPILSADDERKEEEETNIFIIQLPSDLPLRRRGDVKSSPGFGKDPAKRGSAAGAGSSSSSSSSSSGGARATGPTGAGVDDGKPALPPGHLGKLQVHASGKAFLVRDDGSRYRVNAGVSSSFAQFLGAIDLEEQIVAKNAAMAKASIGGAGGASTGAGKLASDRDKGSPLRLVGKAASPDKDRDAAAAGAVAGTLRLMGALTRKWLVTPAFDIGTRAAGAGGAMVVDDD